MGFPYSTFATIRTDEAERGGAVMRDGHWSNSSTTETAGGSAGLTQEEIRAELEAVLASHEFRASKRSQDFLRFVTQAALNGNSETLKERTIAVEVFGRPPTYDPSKD